MQMSRSFGCPNTVPFLKFGQCPLHAGVALVETALYATINQLILCRGLVLLVKRLLTRTASSGVGAIGRPFGIGVKLVVDLGLRGRKTHHWWMARFQHFKSAVIQLVDGGMTTWARAR